MTFYEFLAKWRNGTLSTDAAWRAYAIEEYVRMNRIKAKHVMYALKALKLAYAGELAIPEFCARYDVPRDEAPHLLSCWHLWSLLDRGRPCRVPLRMAKGGLGVSP